MKESEFREELGQMVARRASGASLVETLAFVTEISERLEEDPVFGEFILAEYASQDRKGRHLKIHGFTELDESDKSISLVVGRWSTDPEPAPLTTNDVALLQGGLANFAGEALAGALDERMEPSSPAHAVASTLRQSKDEISCIRLHIFSNQNLSQRFKREFRSSIVGVPTETHIWDFQRLMALYGSARERELLRIDLGNFGSKGIPYIAASKADGLRSYLCVIDGALLADLFERYGSRLLEGNVRSFLGMKGAVNKGIRATIADAPGLFFAYNNGIAATAMDVEMADSPGTKRIVGFSDLQIVNGGQTTASVLRARKQDRLSLEGVAVPMKLTVVARQQAQDLIPKIAEYANTQNKVAIADFFANHPFHRRMEEISRRVLVPAKAGVRVQGKWFYERSRGQYQNERLYLAKAKKDTFDLEFPAKQVINKTELAKYDSTFGEKPHWVSLGAQKNFLKFAAQFSPKGEKTEAEYWGEISPQFGEDYFKRMAAMAILWKAGEDVVAAGKGGWYLGDYRPQIVAYAWALVLHSVRAAGRELDLGRVWLEQGTDTALQNGFGSAARLAQKAILEMPSGSTNVGEWTKREGCWLKVAQLKPDLGPVLEGWVIGREVARERQGSARRQGRQDDGIALQAEVLGLAQSGYWRSLAGWASMRALTTEADRALVERAASPAGALRIATDREWKRLMDVKARCEEEGFRFRTGS